jgi:type VI secretion system secreted protein Hcp
VALVDFFLKIDGIPGESPDAKHKGEIDLEAFSWGAANVGAQPGGPGGGAGKVALQDLHFTTKVNKASPMLFLACATGKHIKQAILTARKAGKTQQEFLIIKMTDVLISSYQASGSEAGADLPMDQVSFNFARLDYEYRPQNPDGSLGPPVKSGWDVKKGKPV